MNLDSTRSLENSRRKWHSLRAREKVRIFRHLPLKDSAKFFTRLDADSQATLLLALEPAEQNIWLHLLPPDEAADLILCAPTARRNELLSALDDRTRVDVQVLLTYRSDVAGGLMTPRFARLRPEHAVDEAIGYLRQQAPNLATLDSGYALDEEQHLLGAVFLHDLFCADRNKTVRDIMHTDCLYVTEDMDQEHVARLLAEHRLQAVPVVDQAHRMKGVITADDLLDVVTEEATEDIQKLGGMEALDAPYLQISLWRMIQKRAGWLAILFLGEMLTATAMGYYERQIERAVVLALFIPLVISTGGNSGSQATTLVIRAMALGQVRLADWWRVIWRELTAGVALGIFLGLIGFARIVIWQTVSPVYGEFYLLIGLSIATSLVGVVLFGSIAGAMLPFILSLVRLDPASASAPFVATLVDVTGLVIYFTVSSIILRGTLL